MNKLRSIFRLVLVNVLVLLGLLFLVEALLRFWGNDYGNSPADADPYLNWVHPRDYRYTLFSVSGEFGGYPVYFDKEGRRAQLPEKTVSKTNTRSLWLIGDSFTEALQVPYDSSFAGQLSKAFPQTDVLNYGVTGYSPIQYYLQLKKQLQQAGTKPRLVLLTLYSNDVRDDSTLLSRAVYDSTGKTIIAINGGSPGSWKALLRKTYLVKNLNRVYLQWQYRRSHSDTGTAVFKSADGLEERPELEGTLTGNYLVKIAGLLTEQQIPLVITAIPSRYKTVVDPAAGPAFSDKVKQWCAARQIPYCDLEQGFLSATETQRSSFFFHKDIHCTASGHARIGDLLVPCVEAYLK